jgi:hypothetical protein
MAVWDKFDIAGQQLSPIRATCLGYVEYSLADPQVLAHRQSCQLSGFPHKDCTERGNFLGLLRIRGFFRSILKVSYKRAFIVKCFKNMACLGP